MILSCTVMELKSCVGDPFGCEEGVGCGTRCAGEIERGLVKNIVEGACIGVPQGGICEGGGGSML